MSPEFEIHTYFFPLPIFVGYTLFDRGKLAIMQYRAGRGDARERVNLVARRADVYNPVHIHHVSYKSFLSEKYCARPRLLCTGAPLTISSGRFFFLLFFIRFDDRRPPGNANIIVLHYIL